MGTRGEREGGLEKGGRGEALAREEALWCMPAGRRARWLLEAELPSEGGVMSC